MELRFACLDHDVFPAFILLTAAFGEFTRNRSYR